MLLKLYLLLLLPYYLFIGINTDKFLPVILDIPYFFDNISTVSVNSFLLLFGSLESIILSNTANCVLTSLISFSDNCLLAKTTLALLPPKVVENLPSGNLFVVYSCSGFALDFNNDCPNPKVATAPKEPATAPASGAALSPKPAVVSLIFFVALSTVCFGFFAIFTALPPTFVAVDPTAPATALGTASTPLIFSLIVFPL